MLFSVRMSLSRSSSRELRFWHAPRCTGSSSRQPAARSSPPRLVSRGVPGPAPQVCTLCAREGLVAAGGFGGELVARRVGSDTPFACRWASFFFFLFWPRLLSLAFWFLQSVQPRRDA